MENCSFQSSCDVEFLVLSFRLPSFEMPVPEMQPYLERYLREKLWESNNQIVAMEVAIGQLKGQVKTLLSKVDGLKAKIKAVKKKETLKPKKVFKKAMKA